MYIFVKSYNIEDLHFPQKYAITIHISRSLSY